MKPVRISSNDVRPGLVLTRDLRISGEIVLAKGRLVTEEDAQLLRKQPVMEVHVVELERDDLHEEVAGRRLAAAVAGDGIEVQAAAGGTLPLAARHRGILEVDAARLARLNDVDDVVVATLPHGQIVVEGEIAGRAKIIPFVTNEDRVRRAESLAQSGLLAIRRFKPMRVGAVVEDRLEEEALARFRRDFEEKVRFFGSTLLPPTPSAGSADALAAALRATLAAGAQLVLVAAGRAMDPLDPALQGLDRAGGRLLKHGIPAHPGALLWLGVIAGEVPVIGVPSCGIASRATALDLLLPWLFTGERPSRERLAALGAGGMLTRESAFRLPPYRRPGPRGELDPQ